MTTLQLRQLLTLSLFFIAIQLIIKMKSTLMRAPAISQIYNQKVTYQNHLRKLQRIREQRKQVLNVDHTRHMQLQHIKDGKSRTFANKFNENNYQINQSNLKFLTKLQNVKSFARYTSYVSSDRLPRDPSASPKPLPAPVKRKIIETEKENSRIFFRMRSVSSNLSKDRLLSDYAKAEKIKQRITKYALQNNKISLKSQKYFAQNKSNVSTSSIKSNNTERKRSPASFYKKEDIIRNRVVKTDIKTIKARGLPSLGRGLEEGHFVEDKAFFTTEPLKNRRVASHRPRPA